MNATELACQLHDSRSPALMGRHPKADPPRLPRKGKRPAASVAPQTQAQAQIALQREFGRRLRAARIDAKLTQEAVAKRSGMSRPYISDVERGLQNLTMDTMLSLARAIGLELQVLLRQPSSTK
jgi:DNA-binding XRE family transcriptional regulator